MTDSAPTLQFSSFADIYERDLVGPLFRPWAELLIGRVQPLPGERVLDVACGTGIVARLARARVGNGSQVVGVDPSAPMLAVARRTDPSIEFREGSASALPIGQDERFDVLTCQQGLQFFPDKLLAAQEFRRVLALGGRLAVATWRPVQETPFLHRLQRICEEQVGPLTDIRHSYGDDHTLASLLSTAGFEQVRVDVESLSVRFNDWTVFVRLNASALIGMSQKGKLLSEEDRMKTVAAIVTNSEKAVQNQLNGRELTYELRANVATARG